MITLELVYQCMMGHRIKGLFEIEKDGSYVPPTLQQLDMIDNIYFSREASSADKYRYRKSVQHREKEQDKSENKTNLQETTCVRLIFKGGG